VSQLSIKSPSGEERIRLDPGGITIFGQRDRQEQLRLEFGGMRFFTDAGETSRFNSNELSFADGDTGLRCSLDWRYLVCEDEKSGGLSATFGILAPPKGSLTPQQTEYFKKMARTPHLSLSNLKTTSNIDLLVVPEPSIMVSSEAGKTVLSGGVRSTANGIRVPDVPSITVSDKTSRVLWKAP
jgi:hypothetical protein